MRLEIRKEIPVVDNKHHVNDPIAVPVAAPHI
jgi:hypothetical protein